VSSSADPLECALLVAVGTSKPRTTHRPARAAARCAAIRAAAAVCFAAACATLSPPPEITPRVVAAAESLGFTRAELEHGRDAFARSCGRCHARPDPRTIPASGWESVLERMEVKARSSAQDRSAVRAYVLTCAGLDPEFVRPIQ